MSYDYPDGYVPEPYVPPTDWWIVLALCLADAAVWTVIDPDRLEANDWLDPCRL